MFDTFTQKFPRDYTAAYTNLEYNNYKFFEYGKISTVNPV